MSRPPILLSEYPQALALRAAFITPNQCNISNKKQFQKGERQGQFAPALATNQNGQIISFTHQFIRTEQNPQAFFPEPRITPQFTLTVSDFSYANKRGKQIFVSNPNKIPEDAAPFAQEDIIAITYTPTNEDLPFTTTIGSQSAFEKVQNSEHLHQAIACLTAEPPFPHMATTIQQAHHNAINSLTTSNSNNPFLINHASAYL